MKRRNFLSGLLAAPLALKARFFSPKVVYEPITPRQLEMAHRFAQMLADAKSKHRRIFNSQGHRVLLNPR